LVVLHAGMAQRADGDVARNGEARLVNAPAAG